MGGREVGDVNVVADRRAVGRVVVVAKHRKIRKVPLQRHHRARNEVSLNVDGLWPTQIDNGRFPKSQ
jgi:hypothetical protein